MPPLPEEDEGCGREGKQNARSHMSITVGRLCYAWSGVDLQRDDKAEKEANESGEKEEIIDESLNFLKSVVFRPSGIQVNRAIAP